MLRTTISKIRHVCALAYFVPHLLRGNIRYVPGRFEKLSASVQRRVDNSTDSGSKEESDYERCQRIIDRAFSPNLPQTYYIPDKNTKHTESLLHMTTPETPESQCEKCQRIINKIFGEDSNVENKKTDIVDPVCIPLTELQATTAKESVETLAQKIEVIDETPLVEAAAKSKIEGFNIHPKVLGNRRKRRTGEKLTVLQYSTDKSVHGRRRGSSRKDSGSSFDELAKRCLDSPSGQIDERLLKEMEKLGVPTSTRRGSRRTANDAGIVQPDIMRRPRRPVEKTELDFLSRMKRLRELERLNEDLPPPFELITVKANSVNLPSSYDVEDNTFYVERIQPYYLTDLMESQSNNTPNKDVTSSSFCEKQPQKLLGHITAAVISNESDMMSDKRDDYDHLIIRQERLKPLQSNVDSVVGWNNNREPGVVIRNSTDEKISLVKLKQMDLENAAISSDRVASTNPLSDIVDPNVISPQTEPSDLIKEYLDKIRQERLKPLQSNVDSELGWNDNREPGVVIRNSTDEEISLVKLKQMDLENAAISSEKLASTNLLSDMVDPNVISPQTEPSDLIKECKEMETLRNLLQTRFEHLTKNSVKTSQLKEFTTEFSKDSTLIKDSIPVQDSSSIIDSSPIKDSSSVKDSLHIESLPIKNSALNIEVEEQKSIETLRVERIKPYYLKEDLNILCKETSPPTDPSILIRETTNNVSIKETADLKAIFRGYSPYQGSVTPHQLLEQISYISRETELGTIDNYQEIDYSRPEKSTPSQLLDNVGVVCKDDLSSMQQKSLPENNVQNMVAKESDQHQAILDSYNRDVSDNGAEDYEYTNLIEHQDCAVKLLQNTLLSSSELSRRALTEEETDEPVIAVEMGRIDSAAGQDTLTDHNLLVSTLNRETGQEQFADYNVLSSALHREPVLQEMKAANTVVSNTVGRETLINPLLDQATVPHVATENINTNTSATTIPKEHPPKPLTLSEMLKKVRERNRKELYKGFAELKIQNTQVDPVIGECGKKNPPCPPPAPTCPPPPKPPCPPKKPPCPNPCKPKCEPTCPPASCEPKPKCPPPKKSPCDKFQKTKCSSVKIQDALTLLLYLGPQLHIPQKSMLPIIACALNLNISIQNSKTKGMDRIFTRLQDLCSIVLSDNLKDNKDIDELESLLAENEGTNYAKTYDPWTPIPSWPIPVKEEKRKLVCPKEGCKVIPPKLNAPCRDINPCAHLPRHNKYTVVDFILHKFGKNVVYDVGEA